MHRALPIVLIAILLPLGGAAQQFGGAAQPLAAPAASGDPVLDRAIKKANTDWIAAMHTGNAAKEAEPYEDDAVFVALDGTSTRGRAEIEAMMKERFAHDGLAVATKIEPRRILREGNLAIEFGTAEIRREGTNGQETVKSGSSRSGGSRKTAVGGSTGISSCHSCPGTRGWKALPASEALTQQRRSGWRTQSCRL